MSKLNDYLTEAGVFFLATVDGIQAKCRPLGLHLEADGKVMFGVGDFKSVYRQLRKNARVEIVAYKQDNTWLRYTGHVVFEKDEKYAQMALETHPELRDIYNADTGHKLMMFHLENSRAGVIPMMGEGIDITKDDEIENISPVDSISEDQAKEMLTKGLPDAEKIVKDNHELERFLQRLEKKMKRLPLVGKQLAAIPTLFSLVSSYSKNEYTDVPIGSVIAAVSALAYWLAPVDLIPDVIPVVGQLDDAAVATACLTLISSDLEDYEAWREKAGITDDSPIAGSGEADELI